MALSRTSKWFLTICIVIVVGIGAALVVLDDRLGGFGGVDVAPGQPVEIEVAPGTSVRAVGQELAERGVVRRSGSFVNAASNEQLEARLQPGGYDLETGMTDEEAVAVFLEGPARPASVRFTIPEGLPVELILERLGEAFEDHAEQDFRDVLDERLAAGGNAEGVLELPGWAREPADADEDIIEPFEGLLFPETYEVGLDATPLQVLQRMVDQTASVMERLLAETDADEDLDPYEVLIQASLVERETRVDEERPRVAGVIHNRLEADMRLQVDATVLYAKGEHTALVALDDLDIDSPYNTYRIDGLPPAPIAAPGAAAVRSVLEPEEHDLRFYVLAPECDGSHQFAEDEGGHQANVAAFREAGRCQ